MTPEEKLAWINQTFQKSLAKEFEGLYIKKYSWQESGMFAKNDNETIVTLSNYDGTETTYLFFNFVEKTHHLILSLESNKKAFVFYQKVIKTFVCLIYGTMENRSGTYLLDVEFHKHDGSAVKKSSGLKTSHAQMPITLSENTHCLCSYKKNGENTYVFIGGNIIVFENKNNEYAVLAHLDTNLEKRYELFHYLKFQSNYACWIIKEEHQLFNFYISKKYPNVLSSEFYGNIMLVSKIQAKEGTFSFTIKDNKWTLKAECKETKNSKIKLTGEFPVFPSNY